MEMPIDTASSLLVWSNRIYVGGAILTLVSAGFVLYEKYARNTDKFVRWKLLTELLVVTAALISLCGALGAIVFSNTVSHIKDVELDTFKEQSKKDIEEAKKDATNSMAKAIENALDLQKNATSTGQLQTAQRATTTTVGRITTARKRRA